MKQDDLDVLEGIAQRCIIEDKKILGIEMDDGTKVYGKITILTTGTYMASNIMISDEVTNFGPDNEPTTPNLSQSLRDAGLKTFRLKTGTPPRVLTSTIDFSKTSYQPGTDEFIKSFLYCHLFSPGQLLRKYFASLERICPEHLSAIYSAESCHCL